MSNAQARAQLREEMEDMRWLLSESSACKVERGYDMLAIFGPESDAFVGVIEKLLEHPGDEEVIAFAREMLREANRLGFRYPSVYPKPEPDCKFLCVDCGKNTRGGEYYSVHDELWAASGLGPNDGMLCLACLEKRIGRPLTIADFVWTCLPSLEVWQRHVAPRGVTSLQDWHDAKVVGDRRLYERLR
jgi:hypothetical protein